MSDPTFQQLRVFLVVAEELHFGRAAARLHLAQPPVSRHIKALECVLGVPLFERGSRGVTLTPAGVLLCREARALLRRWDNAATMVADLSRGEHRRVVLGVIESMAIDSLPAVVKTMRARHPDIVWELSEGHTEGLVDGFGTARFDAVIVRGTITAAPDCSVLIHEDELVVVLPAGHRLTGDEIELADLADEDFIVYSRQPTSVLLNVTLSACRHAGFVPRIRHEALGTELILGLVAAGDGLAMVSKAVARSSLPGIRFAHLAGRPAVSRIMLAWHGHVPAQVMHELAELLRTANTATTPSGATATTAIGHREGSDSGI
ncbi:LysR substrate-binding domain-containing protein [Streptomyces sp. NPDC017991]|uniref:LysR substrate-binding domain-containing protein n=1 Tax=Streptomyces sp. NPDC017991 TaxID=3365026 RepID=UPI003796CDD9